MELLSIRTRMFRGSKEGGLLSADSQNDEHLNETSFVLA
jgi:hypothetical protein